MVVEEIMKLFGATMAAASWSLPLISRAHQSKHEGSKPRQSKQVAKNRVRRKMAMKSKRFNNRR